MSRIPFKRTLAALVSLSFLWAFAACVSLCAADVEETQHESRTVLSAGMNEVPMSESCPVVEISKATLIDRLSVQAAEGGEISPAMHLSSLGYIIFNLHDSLRRSSTDPPFERLRTLRI